MINDRPFNSDEIVIQPTALHELGLQRPLANHAWIASCSDFPAWLITTL
jgi:hypothetical protein